MSLRTIFKTQLTDVNTSEIDVVGSLRWENDKLYKYVELRNDTATVAGVAGDPVAYGITRAGVTEDGVATGLVVLDVTDAAAQPITAGFLMGTVTGTLDTSYYCWIQLTGEVTVPTAVTTGVVGSGCMHGGDKTLVVTTGVIFSTGILITASGANNKVIAHCPY